MREIAVALSLGGYGVVEWTVGHFVRQILLRKEKEELILFLVEFAWNIDRTTDVAADGVVTIASTRRTGSVAEEVVGVERFIANVIIGQAVEVRGATLGDNIHYASRGFAVFRLIGVEQNLDLG